MKRLLLLTLAALAALGLNLSPLVSAQEAEPTIEMGTPPEAPDPYGPPIPGSRGNPWTAVMQQWLRTNGFRPGPVDAHFGPVTQSAVIRFQRAAGIPDHGWWDWETSQAQRDYSPPPAPITPTSGNARGRCAQWYDEAMAAGFSDDQWPTVDRIMYRESMCQPGAYNRSGASGLMQIMPMWADDCGGSRQDLFDPAFNLRCAVHVKNVQGWDAWSTY